MLKRQQEIRGGRMETWWWEEQQHIAKGGRKVKANISRMTASSAWDGRLRIPAVFQRWNMWGQIRGVCMTLCKHVKMHMCMLHVLLLSNIYLFSSRPDLECGSALHKAVDAFSTTVSDASASSLHNIQEDFGQQIWVCVLWCTPQNKVQTRLKRHPSNYMRQNCMTGEQNRTTDQTQSLKSKSKCKC